MKDGVENTENSSFYENFRKTPAYEYLLYAAYPSAKMVLTIAGQPFFRLMVEQQVHGTSIFDTIKKIARNGPQAFFYGSNPAVIKEFQKSVVQMVVIRNASDWTDALFSQFAPSLSESQTAKAISSGTMLAGFEWLLCTPVGRYTTWASSQGIKVNFFDFSRTIFQEYAHKSFTNQVTGLLSEAYKAGGVNLAKQWVAGTTLFWSADFVHRQLAPYHPIYPNAVDCGSTVIPALCTASVTIPFEGLKTRMQNKTGKADRLFSELKKLAKNPKTAFKGVFPKFVLVLAGNTLAVAFLKKCKSLRDDKVPPQSENNNPPPAEPPTLSIAVSSSSTNATKVDSQSLCQIADLAKAMTKLGFSSPVHTSLTKVLLSQFHSQLSLGTKQKSLPIEIISQPNQHNPQKCSW